eukprot:jgi/Chlat1/3733/Chrsp259S03878
MCIQQKQQREVPNLLLNSCRLLHKLARLMGSGPVLDCAGNVSVTMQARVAEVLSGNGYS